MKLLFLALAISAFHPAPLGTCKGEHPCHQCRNCTQCRYCNSGLGSCSVKAEADERKYEERRKANPEPPR